MRGWRGRACVRRPGVSGGGEHGDRLGEALASRASAARARKAGLAARNSIAHKDFLLPRLDDEPDMTIEKMRELLREERGVRASASTIWALLDRRRQTFKKKSVHASEQDRPDVLEKREAWFEGQLDLDPNKLVFVDETWATTNMAPLYGWAPRGERLRAGIPLGNGRERPSSRACG